MTWDPLTGFAEDMFKQPDKPPEYSGGMTLEYFNSINKLYQQKYGRGIPGSVIGNIKSNRAFADQFWAALNQPQDTLIAANDNDRQKYKSWGMISDQDILNYNQTTGVNKDLTGRLDSYVTNGYIDKATADQIRGMIGVDNKGAGILLDKYFTSGTTPKAKLPDTMEEALKQAKADAGMDVQFDPSIINSWLPTLQNAQKPLMDQELKKSQEYMNGMGRLFSGQTLNLGQDITSKYDADALNKALAYATKDYYDKQNRKDVAGNKLWNYGMWESGNQKESDLMNLQNAWNNADTNMKRSWNLQDLYQNRSWENEDWYNSANLAKQIASMSQDDSNDWTKFLQPAATVAAALI